MPPSPADDVRTFPYLDRFTTYARRALDLAADEARSFHHDYLGSEHLLLGLLRERDGVAARALSYAGVELQRVRAGVEYLVGRGEQRPQRELTPTPSIQRAIELAFDESRHQNHHYIGTEHLMLGLVREGGGVAGAVLEHLGVTLFNIREQVIRVITESTVYVPSPSSSATNGQTALTGLSSAVERSAAPQIFYSYSHKDENLREQLQTHLALLRREGLIGEWHDRKIGAGREWEGEIDARLEAADIVLLLVSADFVASDYCWDVEVKRAMEKHEAGQARVIPVILRPVDWHSAPFGKLQALPRDGRAVTKWGNRDEAWHNIARGIRGAVQELAKRNKV